MAFVIKDRVAETTVTTGTGTVTLLGAMLGFQSFSAIGNGNTTSYLLLSGDQTNWEVGIGTYTSSGTTLARTTILASSNSGSAISLVGSSLVMCSLPANIMQTTGSLFDQLLSSSNGTYNLVRTAGVWSVASAGAGASGSGLFSQVLSATPTASSTGLSTWQAQNGATVSDGTTGIIITGGSASNANWNMRTKTNPVKIITACIVGAYAGNDVSSSGTLGFGLGFTDGTKLHVVQFQNSNLLVTRYSNATTFVSNDYTNGNFPVYSFINPFWLRIKDDGTNITFYYATDGANFQRLYTTTRAAGYLGSSGYTNTFFGVNSNGAIGMGTLLSYAEA